MQIRPVGAELFMRADGRTDRREEASSCFSQFCERENNIHLKKYQNDLSDGCGNYMHHLVLHFWTVRFATRRSFVVILTINIINWLVI